MKWFYPVTQANGRKCGAGPFDSESAANADKAVRAEAYPTEVMGDAFEEEDDYTFPESIVDVGRGDGSRYLVYTDGSTTELT
jgi:hypothetical protein